MSDQQPGGPIKDIAEAIGRGDPHAARQLPPLVYNELLRLAAARLAREVSCQSL
jgi:hypothetical protein